jgi:hypothetical protein
MEFWKKSRLGKPQKGVPIHNKQVVSEEELTSGCPAAFGYLAVLPKIVPIPQQCYFCGKLIDCRSNKKK